MYDDAVPFERVVRVSERISVRHLPQRIFHCPRKAAVITPELAVLAFGVSCMTVIERSTALVDTAASVPRSKCIAQPTWTASTAVVAIRMRVMGEFSRRRQLRSRSLFRRRHSPLLLLLLGLNASKTDVVGGSWAMTSRIPVDLTDALETKSDPGALWANWIDVVVERTAAPESHGPKAKR